MSNVFSKFLHFLISSGNILEKVKIQESKLKFLEKLIIFPKTCQLMVCVTKSDAMSAKYFCRKDNFPKCLPVGKLR